MAEASNPMPGRRTWRFSHDAMACTFEILIDGQDREYARQAADAAFAEVDRLELELSRFIETSDVARVNAAKAGETVRVGLAAAQCLLTGKEIAAMTGGAFDVTVGGALTGERDARTGMGALEVDPETFEVRKWAAGVRVDLGAIGKGYALDRAAEVLRDWGVERALLSSGQSSVRALGGPWRVGVRDPRDHASVLGAIALRDQSISGSGVALHGQHIIDPRSGRPAAGRHGAWAITEDAARSDALSTAFMVMSDEELRAFSAAQPTVGVMSMSSDDATMPWRRGVELLPA